MKTKAAVFTLLLLFAASVTHASNVGFDVNINVGNTARPAVVSPPPVVVPAPVPAPPAIVIEEPPEFIVPSSLGFYVAVGVPYDLFYLSGSYYLYSGDSWYRGRSYNGPWMSVPYKRVPYGLRRHKFERIREIRDREYRIYRGDDHYRGKHFRPEKEWKERRKEAREEWKEERKAEKEERKRHKHHRDDD